jgi:hypothetical protein
MQPEFAACAPAARRNLNTVLAEEKQPFLKVLQAEAKDVNDQTCRVLTLQLEDVDG